ncbi:MAG TPA: PAS domain S-box protein, partial [Candidatus Deferrimicrobium sp.]
MALPWNIPSQRQSPAPPGADGNVPVQIDRNDPNQQRLLISLLDNIPGMVYRGLPDWSLSFVGSEVERLTGYTPEEILAKPKVWRGLIHLDDFRSVREAILSCVRRREPILRMEYRIVRKDGESRWISDRRQMIYDEGGRLLCIDGLCLDISEQKRDEEEKRRLTAAVEHAADAIMVTDAEWIVQYVNPAFEKVTGYAKEEVLGKNPYILAADGENIRVYIGIEEKIRTGSPWKGRLKNKRKDGMLLELDTVVSPIRDPGGKIVNHVVASRDITREVQLEKQARAA